MSVSLASEARPRRRPRRSSKRLSPAVVVLVAAAILGIALLVVRGWRAGRVTLTFVREGGAVPELELTVFPDQFSFAIPSPAPPLGTVHVPAGGSATLAGDLVPQRAVVRYRGEGVGAGVVYVELGRQPAPIELQPPRTIRGRVGEPIGFWTYGWRCAGLRPVGDVEVVAMAGGEHGVEVATVRADEQGRFELTGVSASLHPLSLRVLAAGYAISHVAVPDAPGGQPIVAAVQRTKPLRGTIDAPAEVDRSKLCVLVRGLPGVQVTPAADGAFVLDHLPPDVEPRLFVYGLDAWHGAAEVRVPRDQSARLTVVSAAVVRGRILDQLTGEPLVGALVFADDQPAVRSDGEGTFELTQVLPGSVELTAQYRQKRPRRRDGPMRLGRTRVELGGGETLEGIVLKVE